VGEEIFRVGEVTERTVEGWAATKRTDIGMRIIRKHPLYNELFAKVAADECTRL
jgi:hypothetical protein